MDYVKMARDMADAVCRHPGDGIKALAIMSETIRKAVETERAECEELLRDKARWYAKNRSREMGSRMDECADMANAVAARGRGPHNGQA